ncbi:MAG: ATP-binding protein [Actinomycetota bacterium]|nr:ATP-binding protein [Actinomycetota bacterium]
MTIMVTPTEAKDDPVATAEVAVLGTIAIPGRGEQVRAARAFVAGVLRELATPDEAVLDNVTLLTSELVTNAIRHSRSGESGGSVRLVVLAVTDGIRVEVTDSGSAGGSPVVKDDIYTCDGHGLFLVEAVADQWGYRCAGAGTTVWFGLRLSGG